MTLVKIIKKVYKYYESTLDKNNNAIFTIVEDALI